MTFRQHFEFFLKKNQSLTRAVWVLNINHPKKKKKEEKKTPHIYNNNMNKNVPQVTIFYDFCNRYNI